jgi:AraC-like DNA-binding protein
MERMNYPPVEREAGWLHTHRDELAALIACAVRAEGKVEPLAGLHLSRTVRPFERVHTVSGPAFCVIAQGSKEIFLGPERYQYDPAHYLLVTAALPLAGHVLEASPERPYLSLRLELDPSLVGSVIVEAGHPAPHRPANVRAIDVSALDAGLLDAVVRLVRLVDLPAEARFMAPLITREIIYRLLQGEQGARLRHMADPGGHTHRIASAIERLRRDFNQPLRIERLARELGMSVSGFHHHFKAVTALSPLQFQKQLRLQEARRLMLGEHLDDAAAAHRVGYGNASHFNREYKRLFGLPPIRDVERLRAAARLNAALA